MRYLKIFESFTSDKFEEQIEDLFIGMTDDLGAGIQVVMDQFTNAGPRMERLQVKILLPHGYEHSPMDVYYKIRNELVPIHNKIMKDYGLKFSGCSQLKRFDDPDYYGVINLIYYKYEDQKQFESFGTFQLDEISKQEYYSILDNNPLVYIPESKVLEFKSKLSKEYKLLYARGDKKDTVEYFRAEYETEIDYHFTCKSFSIKKKSLGDDEPCYIMFYNYEEFTSLAAPKSHIETLPDQKRKSFQKKSYYRFEESDFNQMCKNPQILLDYLEKNLDNTPINESYFDEIPEPELMDDNEWYDEVTNAEEVDFTQKEKELFISLSDTILVKHKIDALEIGDSHLSFSMVNGEDRIYPNLRSTTVIRSITSYKNDDEFYYVSVWEGDDIDGGTKSHHQYRCDGYVCWEKFLKEIFKGYRELISKGNKTNESMFDEVPEPRSLLDENGDYIEGSSRLRMNNREPFNQKEKSFINQLLETLNEDYISTNFSDSSEFVLNMGEMGETTHGMRVVKMEDDYYEVQYRNYVDSDDKYIHCQCDGFKCLSKLLIELFGKIKMDYDYE